MVLSVLILLTIFLVCFTLLLIYTKAAIKHFYESQRDAHHQTLKCPTPPKMDILTKQLPSQLNLLKYNKTSYKTMNKNRSNSYANASFLKQCKNHKRYSMVHVEEITKIQFSLPLMLDEHRSKSLLIQNRGSSPRSIAMESLIHEIQFSKEFNSFLLKFSITYFKNSQIEILLHSLISPMELEQIKMKVKLIPDGKTKYLTIAKISKDENSFSNSNEYRIQFSNVLFEELNKKSLLINFNGKTLKKTKIKLGQIGQIFFNQIQRFQNNSSFDFIHEIEIARPSMEIFVLLEKSTNHNVTVDIKSIRGLKFDQKHTKGKTCFFQVVLLEYHRPLLFQQTKYYQLKSTTFSINEPINFNLLDFHFNDLDRFMIKINFYSNQNNTDQHECIARLKLASPYLCSGTGSMHWQSFKEQNSFSMWHYLTKQ